jgi:hypothetical protein
MKLTDVRIELKRAGYIDAGEWHKPVYAVRFYRGNQACSVPISKHSGNGNRPIGQDLLDAMESYIQRGQITASELLSAPVRA